MYALEVRSLSKAFGGVHALRHVGLNVRCGEVHGLLGANGSGKSTLIKILAGFHRPDGGEIRLWGNELRLPVQAAANLGIAVVHQDIGLVSSMSVLDNVSVSSGYSARALGKLDLGAERAKVATISRDLDLDLDLDATVAETSPSKRPLIGILRALRNISVGHEKVLFVLDEPTAYLPGREAEEILKLMRRIAEGGAGVIFVSHRLSEVLSFTDRISVLKDGRNVAELVTRDTDASEVASFMFGTSMSSFYPERHSGEKSPEDPLLEVASLAGKVLRDFSIRVSRGEIVGVAGLLGMGQEELPYLIAESAAKRDGVVRLLGHLAGAEGHVVPSGSMALIPSDRLGQGAWGDASIAENISLPYLGSMWRKMWLSPRDVRRLGEEWIAKLGIRTQGPDTAVGNLSGGNQQKVVLARALNGKPAILLLHEPTQGVDAAARKEILSLIRKVVDQGGCALMVSGDQDELAAMCDRVLILKEGRVACEILGAALSAQSIAAAC